MEKHNSEADKLTTAELEDLLFNRPYAKRINWTDDLEKRLINLYNHGHTRLQMASLLGCTHHQVNAKLKVLHQAGTIKHRNSGYE